MAKFLIAGLKVEMNPINSVLKSRSEKYRCDFEGEPDIKLTLPENCFDRMRQKVPSLTDELAEYMATSMMFYGKLLKHNGFLLHSSCIRYADKAYLFTADSGTGKSTHTNLWKEYIDGVEFVNDDKPAIRLIDGVYYACGTPWSGKTPLNSDVLLPVGGVALLKRGKENVIEPAKPQKVVPFLLKQTQIPDELATTDIFAQLLDGFVRNTPIFEFACDISEEAVKTSFEALTGEKYVKRI